MIGTIPVPIESEVLETGTGTSPDENVRMNTMDQHQFLSEVGLTVLEIPMRARWIMAKCSPGFNASARLDLDPEAGQVEFGVYESAPGDATYISGRAQFDRETGVLTLNNEAETIFERFCETVRLMKLDELTPAGVDAEVLL